MQGRPNLAGYAYALAVLVIWVGFSLSGRHAALGSGVRLTPWDLGAVRHMVAFPAALLLWGFGAGRGLPWRRSLPMGLLAGIGFPLPSYLGFTFAPAAHGAVILSGLLPFLVAIAGWAVFGERWSRGRALSLLVLLAGVSVLGYEAYVQGARPGAWRGDLLFLLSSVSWAAYTMLARHWAAAPMQAIVAAGLWGGGVYLPIWSLALPSHLGSAPLGEIAYQTLFQGLIASVVSLFVFTRALNALGTVRLATVTALVPGLTGVLSAPLLGEEVGLLSMAGLALVCAAVALGVRR